MENLVRRFLGFWNINGRIYLLKSSFINNWIKSNLDLLFVTEIHLTKGQKFDIEDFKVFHNSFSSVENVKPRGGISFFIKPTHLVHVKKVNVSVPENISVQFKNGDIIFGTYITPADLPYYDRMEFSNIANMFIPLNYERAVFGGGDLNSRVSRKM